MRLSPVAASMLCMILAGTAVAKDDAKPHKGTSSHNKPQPTTVVIKSTAKSALDKSQLRFTFSDKERSTLKRYHSTSPSAVIRSLPPGLAKKAARGKPLPPGWQKKLAAGQVIDPVVLAHAQPLPRHILGQLPPQPDGTIVVTVDNKAVRLIEATQTIIDVFDLK